MEKRYKVWTDHYVGGTIKEEWHYYLTLTSLFNDKKTKHGWYTSYHPNGECHCRGIYEEDQREGEFVVYSADGALQERSTFKGGKLNGVSYKRYDDGKIGKGNFRNGVRDGRWFWYHNGLRIAQGHLKDGVIDGRWIWFWDNGNKCVEGRFENGKLKEWAHWDEEDDYDAWLWDKKDEDEESTDVAESEDIFEDYFHPVPLFYDIWSENDQKKDWQTGPGADPWTVPAIPPRSALDIS